MAWPYRLVETSTIVPVAQATDAVALNAAIHATLDRLVRVPGTRAPTARLVALAPGPDGVPRATGWHHGQPLPDGTVTLICVADALI